MEHINGIKKLIELFMTDLEIRYDTSYGLVDELSPEDVRREYKNFRELISIISSSMNITLPEEYFHCGSQLRNALDRKD